MGNPLLLAGWRAGVDSNEQDRDMERLEQEIGQREKAVGQKRLEGLCDYDDHHRLLQSPLNFGTFSKSLNRLFLLFFCCPPILANYVVSPNSRRRSIHHRFPRLLSPAGFFQFPSSSFTSLQSSKSIRVLVVVTVLNV